MQNLLATSYNAGLRGVYQDQNAFLIYPLKNWKPGDSTPESVTRDISLGKIVFNNPAFIPPPSRTYPFELTKADFTGDGVALTWNSSVDRIYQIQKSTDLNLWTPIGLVTATGTRSFKDFPMQPAAKCGFYRVVETKP